MVQVMVLKTLSNRRKTCMNNEYPVYPEDNSYDRPKNPYSPV